MKRIQADVAFGEGDRDTALRKYAVGIGQIMQHGGYGMYYIDRELERLEGRLEELPGEKVFEWLMYFREAWSEKSGEGNRYLLNWCDRQMVRVKLDLFA